MTIPYSKYTGCGNDFIVIDNRQPVFFQFPSIPHLCDRKAGIGADGIILLENSKSADYKMRIYNSDGSEAEMCGNGIRCLMKFLHEVGEKPSACSVETMLKQLRLELDGEQVCVEMGDPFDMQWDLSIDGLKMDYLNTGVPHAIIFVDELESINPNLIGPPIRYHREFAPKGTNVNFARLNPSGVVQVRTYERGVEAETLACGTGATATAIAASHRYRLKSPVRVLVQSGEQLKIAFEWQGKRPTQVMMTGPAKKVGGGTLPF